MQLRGAQRRGTYECKDTVVLSSSPHVIAIAVGSGAWWAQGREWPCRAVTGLLRTRRVRVQGHGGPFVLATCHRRRGR